MEEFQEDKRTCNYYEPTKEEIEETLLLNWYAKLEKVTIKTILLPVPDYVLKYFRAKSVALPRDTESSSFKDTHLSSNESLNWSDEDDAEEARRTARSVYTEAQSDDSDDEQDGLEHDESHIFDKLDPFDSQVKRAIDKLGGSVFPKLNFKSPSDAKWMAFNRCLRCYLPGDIYLLMKSSDVIYNELFHSPLNDGAAVPENGKYHLALRKWEDIDPAAEFRCFVFNDKLVCISQRDTNNGFEKIMAERDSIIEDIFEFFKTSLYQKLQLQHYVFDVFRQKAKTVKLVDLHVFGSHTDPLLFSYKEIKMLTDEFESRASSVSHFKDAHIYGDPHFRFIGDQGRSHPVTWTRLT